MEYSSDYFSHVLSAAFFCLRKRFSIRSSTFSHTIAHFLLFVFSHWEWGKVDTMAYQLHEKSPGGSIQQSPITQYEQGMEPVDYHGQYPEHYIPGPEPPQVHTPSTSTYTPQMKSDLPPVPPATTKTGATTLGMKRSVFWILVGLLVLLVVLVIGLGAGLGTKVAQANSQ